MSTERGSQRIACGVLEQHGLDVGLWRLDPVTGAFDVSRTWVARLGYAEVGGTWPRWLDHVVDEDRRRVDVELWKHLAGLSVRFDTEYRVRDERGEVRWIRSQGHVERGTGRASMHGHHEEITDRKRREDDLAQGHARFRRVIDGLADGIAVHRDGSLQFVNGQFAAMLGRSADSLEGESFVTLVHVDDRPRLLELAAPCPRIDLRFTRQDGSVLDAELTVTAIDLDDGSALMAVVRDVSERKRLQARLAQTERMATLGTLAAGVAHEINNPLSYVSTNIDLITVALTKLAARARELQREPGAPAADGAGPMFLPATFDDLLEMARDARSGSARVKSIVQDLKLFSRPTDQPSGPVSLREVLEMALKITAHEIRTRAQLVSRIGAAPPVLADAGRLCQVFVNLLVNAAQAIPAGRQDTNTIRVTLRSEGGHALVEIADTGSGIRPEDLPRIFDPFFTTKPAAVGSGLGLAICQHILYEFGGAIEVDSEVGHGTVMTVRLPTCDERADTDRETAPGGVPATRPLRRRRVLVIDDEPAICRSVDRVLSQAHETVALTSGAEALGVLDRDQGFDLVLCDLVMHGVSGQDVFETVKAKHPLLAERFVFMTGGATNPHFRAFLESVGNCIIHKPIDLAQLEALMRRLGGTAQGIGTSSPSLSPIERRRGIRRDGASLVAVLHTREDARRCPVVDYSVSGLRIGWPSPARAWAPEQRTQLVLGREPATEAVRADIRLVRTIDSGARLDLCFEIADMDARSRSVYDGWLAASA